MKLSKEKSLDSLGLTAGFHSCISELTKCLGYNGKLIDLLSTTLPDPEAYKSPSDLERFWTDYQLYNIVRKSDPLNLSKDDQAALRQKTFFKWMETELENEKANSKFALGPLMNHGSYSGTIVRAQCYLQEVLGSFDRQKIDGLQDKLAFTGGATTTHKRSKGDTYYKLTEPLGVTEKARDLALVTMWTDPNWNQIMCDNISVWPYEWLQNENGARWDAVRKTFNILRPIAIQPTGNQLLQSSLGRTIRDLFTDKTGIDLRHSWELNKAFAMESSFDSTELKGQNATVDGESASALYSYNLVEILLHRCPGWFAILDAVRCDLIEVPRKEALAFGSHYFVNLDGKYYRRSTGFMDMGVGFCFELQSVFFWALAKALCVESSNDHCIDNISIFGDDLIIPNSAFAEWGEFATYLNFKVNKTKSFSGTDILFRESCGGHYFDGTDITPVLRKEQSGQSVIDWLWLLNTVYLKEMYWEKKSVRKWYKRWRSSVEESFPLCRNTCVPPSYGLVTGWVESDPDLVPQVKYLRTNYFTITALHTTQTMHEFNGHSALHAHLFGGKVEQLLPRPWETNTLSQTTEQSNNVLVAQLPDPSIFGRHQLYVDMLRGQTAPASCYIDAYITHYEAFVSRTRSLGYKRAVSKGKVIQQSWNQGWWS